MKLEREVVNRLNTLCKEFVNCYYQLNLHKRGHKCSTNSCWFRYYNTKHGVNVYVVIDFDKKKFMVKRGRHEVDIEIDLSDICMNELDEKLVKCGVVEIFKELEKIGVAKIIKSPESNKRTKIEFNNLRKLLDEDIEKVLLPGNEVMVDLYKPNPYFRMIVTIPKSGVIETNLVDKFKTNIEVSSIIFEHTTNLEIKVSNVIQGIPQSLDTTQKYVSIYYEYFTSKYELTKFPTLIFIPVTLLKRIYVCNGEPKESDLRKLVELCGEENINNDIDSNYLTFKLLNGENNLCVEFVPFGVVKFPMPKL